MTSNRDKEIMVKPILIVADDEPGIRNFVRNVAEPLGYDVGEAGTGKEFRDLFGNVPTDVIILDLAMPEEHGPQLFDFIHEHHLETKIILVTGYSKTVLGNVQQQGIEKGLNIIGALNKPINIDDLEKLLKEALPPPN
jgi:DNA-binding NtrC family response regulator